MAIPPRNHRISLSDAVAMIKRHRAATAATDVKAHAYFKDQLLEVLNQKGCEGLRLYLARGSDNAPTLVAVGMDKDGNDMTSGTILEFTMPCPPICGASSALNS
jgi:hypothetical protein